MDALRRSRTEPGRSAIPRALLAALLALVACVAPAPGPGEAECPVCRVEGDWACLCVRIEADTPSCEVDGKTYYFCSEECRAAFLEQADRYPRR